MILEILFVVVMFLWLLTFLPVARLEPFSATSVYFAFIAVLLLGLYMFVPALR